jgi:hypothetical protein
MRTSILVVSSICLLSAGIGLGWMWRGQSDRAGVRVNWVTSAEANRPEKPPGKGVGNVTTSGRNGASSGLAAARVNADEKVESSADAAHRILRSMLEDGGFRNGPPVELFEFLQALAGCDAPTLHELLGEMQKAAKEKGKPFRGGEPVGMMILVRLASLDPEGAMDGLLAMKKTGERMDKEMILFMMAAAAKNDPARTQALIARMPDEESKKAAEMALLIVRARQDPDAVLQELAAAPPKDDAGFSQAREIIRSVAGKSPEKALEVAGKFGNADQQSRMVGEVMQSWLERDAKSAAKWASETMNPAALNACLQADASLVDADKLCREFNSINTATPDVRNQLAASLAGNLAKKDVSSALAWSSTLTDVDQTTAHASIGRSWIDKDPVSASEWLASWPQSSAKDGVASYLVNKISADDPESAFVWACSIQGEPRIGSISRALNAMKAKDPAAAEQAMNGLPESERANVRRVMELKKFR